MNTAEQRLAWALEVCRRAQVRMTPVRQGILAFLAGQRVPVGLDTIARAAGVAGHCDATTVYRTLMMFHDADLVRQVGTTQKIKYFRLNVPGESGHYLICRKCGRITELSLPHAVTEEIQRLTRTKHFSLAGQDHEVHGLCEHCHSSRQNAVLPSKLRA